MKTIIKLFIEYIIMNQQRNNINQEYQFINKQSNNNILFQPLEPFEYYQIAIYPIGTNTINLPNQLFKYEKNNNFHEIRIIYFDEFNTIVETTIKYLTKKQFKYILRNVSKTRYKLFSVYNLKYVSLPSISDISIARSSIAN